MSGFDLSNFLASFFDEARERLSSINQALVKFETGGLSDEELISLRRDAHTIKGSALMLGVTDVGQTAHLFEDIMEQLIKNPTWRTARMIQFLYDLHDVLGKRLEDPEAQQLIDVAPLKAQQKDLLEAVKQETSNTQTEQDIPETATTATDNTTNVISLPTSHKPSETLEAHSPSIDNTLSTPDTNVTSDAEPRSFDLSKEKPKEIDTTGLIGADEAQAWKEKRKTSETSESAKEELTSDSIDDQNDNEIASDDGTDSVSSESLEEVLTPSVHAPEADLISESISTHEELNTFRPEIEQMEMKATAQRRSSGRFLRVDAERLEELSNQVIELSTQQTGNEDIQARFSDLSSDFRTLQREWLYLSKSLEEMDREQKEQAIRKLNVNFDAHARKHRRMSEDINFSKIRNNIRIRDLRDQVLSLMLRPLDNIFSTFPRSVRDVSIRLNKRVRLLIGGKTLEMDQGVTESLVEPLVHLLNNAVAHGIESPEERLALGKPEEGQVSIIAKQNGSEIRIEIIDDGQGLDTEKIKQAAVDKGVTTQVEADAMDSAEILEMIFRPGFTTRETVDDTAGRGIGMNVVQDTVRRLTGAIRIQSEVGKGTRFILSLPVSIAVQHALMFRMGNMNFGMLTHMVEQAIPYNTEEIEKEHDGKEFITYENYHVPIVDMRHILTQVDRHELTKKGNIIIAEHIEGYVGIVVDEILDDTEIVVRDLDPYIKRYNPQGLMGNTILSDGSVVMLLEPYGIKEMGRTAPDQSLELHVEEEEKLKFNVLLVDDSLIARQVEKNIFESIGFNVDTAIDGLDGLEKLQAKEYDMVVTDLEMPRLDGFGLVMRIRNQSRYENLPLMIISTRESTEDRMRALEAGADTYMVKQQLKGDEILRTVKALVGSSPVM